MTRPVTLFTGQWADLPLETLAEKAAGFGFDGLELACWGDHFEVDKALESDKYARSRRDILDRHSHHGSRAHRRQKSSAAYSRMGMWAFVFGTLRHEISPP